MMIDMGRAVVVFLGSLTPNTMQPKSPYPQPDKGRLTGQHHATQVHIYPAQQCQEMDFVNRLFSDWLLAMSHKPRRKMLTIMGLPGEKAPHWLCIAHGDLSQLGCGLRKQKGHWQHSIDKETDWEHKLQDLCPNRQWMSRPDLFKLPFPTAQHQKGLCPHH